MSYRTFTTSALWTTQDLDSGGTLTSPAIDLRRVDDEDVQLWLRVTNAGGNASVSVGTQISIDGVTFNAAAAQTLALAATGALGAPEDYHLIDIPWAPFIKIVLTDLATLNDNVVDAMLVLREF